MKIELVIGNKYLLGREIGYSWRKYVDKDECEPLYPVDKLESEHAIYGSVVAINILTDQFVEIGFLPVSNSLHGDVVDCTFTVYDDSIVHLPIWKGYVPYSIFIKSIMPGNPELNRLYKKIDAIYAKHTRTVRSQNEKIKKINNQLRDFTNDIHQQLYEEAGKLGTDLNYMIQQYQENIAYKSNLDTYLDTLSK